MSNKILGPAMDGERGSTISRRDFLKIGGAGLAGATLLGVASCGSGGDQGNGGGGSGGSASSNLVVGVGAEPAILNGYVTGGDSLYTAYVTSGILEAPLLLNPDLHYTPQLADEMPEVLSENPLVIQYRLKDGVAWSDGKPLTSADAKWTFQQIMDPKNKIITRTGWDKISKFETPDERTVKITFKEPYAPWRDLLLSSILPEHIYQNKDFNTALNNSITGSGPFKFKNWSKGQSITVVRNENYWGEKAGLKSLTYRFITDSNSQIAALKAGEISFMDPANGPGVLQQLQGIDGTTVKYKSGANWSHMSFNTEKVDKKLRQAIAYGINRQQILSKVLKGQNVNPLQSVIVPQLKPYSTPAWSRYTYDPDKARQLVEEAKSEGANTDLTYTTTAGVQLNTLVQQIVQQQLKDVGINIEITNKSFTAFSQVLPGGDFEIITFGWSTTGDPEITSLFAADQVPPKGQNYMLYKNQKVTDDLHQSDVTIDAKKRTQLLHDAQNQMAEDCPILPLYQLPTIYAYSSNLQGPQVNPSLAGPYWNVGDWKVT
jgi:peptide/nickel transport system substrate-binding protein